MIPVIYSILLALEVLIISALVSNAIPYPHTPYQETLLLRYRDSIRPERELMLYAIFAAACVLIQTATVLINRDCRLLCRLTFVQAFWVTVEAWAAFHIIMDDGPSWVGGNPMLYGALTLSVLTKVFWQEMDRMFQWGRGQWRDLILRWRPAAWPYAGDLLAVLFIFLVIYIPDPEAVAAWLYMGEQFHQWDGNFMGVDYGLCNGLLPDVDIVSTYGFGLPVMMAGLMKLFGGFGYTNVVKGLCWGGILYYSLWYFLLRRWFVSGLLAFAAIIVGLRAQMFDPVEIPIIWQQVPASIFRYCFDIFFFWAIYKHLHSRRRIFLVLAAAAAGAGLYHMMSTGALLLACLLFYIGMHIVIPSLRPHVLRSPKDGIFLVLVVLSVPALMLLGTWLTVGHNALTRSFWLNVTEYNNTFYNLLATFPLTDSLKRKEFLFFTGGLAYPLLYMGTVLYIGTMAFIKKLEPKFILAALVGVYGLCLHSYYILVSTKYLQIGLPGIFLLFFWLDHIMALRLSPAWSRRTRRTVLGISLYMLLTAPMFTAYPHLLNMSRNPIVDPRTAQRVGHDSYYFNQLYVDFPEGLKLPVNSLGETQEGLKYEKDFKTHQELIDFYRKDTDFSVDAALIRKFTTPGSRVALLSSFEVLILQQAQRKPFFYYFPLLNSRPMRMRSFMASAGSIVTKDNVAKTIGELEARKPEYVFMERIFLTPQVPMWYAYGFEETIDILRYVLKDYEPVETGHYLVAMKRKQ